MGQAKRSKTKETPAERAEAKRRRAIVDTATLVGVPEIQRDPDAIVLAETAIIDGHSRPVKDTVRKLGRVEMLQRSGALTAHEAAACQWYADQHALGFDTIGCTANYEGGGGGAFGAVDLLARHKAQADARDDYRWARAAMKLPGAYLAIFEQIVLGQDTIGAVAAEHFELARSQAEHRTRTILRMGANALGTLIANRLPIEAPAPAMIAKPKPQPTGEQAAAGEPKRTVWLFLDAAIARAAERGQLGAIQIAERTRDTLRREKGCDDSYKGLPLLVRPDWTWGYVVISAEEKALLDLIEGPAAVAGTDEGIAAA